MTNIQGQQRHWDHAVYLQKDFGPSRDWYIKDAMMFTATCTVKRALPPSQCDGLIQTYPTFFGCTKIRKFRLFGEFIYPPLVIRSKFKKFMTGPQLESGLYALLLHWSHLRRFSVGVATPVLLSRLAALLGAASPPAAPDADVAAGFDLWGSSSSSPPSRPAAAAAAGRFLAGFDRRSSSSRAAALLPRRGRPERPPPPSTGAQPAPGRLLATGSASCSSLRWLPRHFVLGEQLGVGASSAWRGVGASSAA
mgnify:CR=1 FL=1